MRQTLTGALMGWRHRTTSHGIALTLQVATSRDAAANGEADKVTIILNDRQLRSFTRDLTRATRARGLDVEARGPWWRLWRRSAAR